MEKQPGTKDSQSRRHFTKTVAATLLSTPIAASMLSCQTSTPTNRDSTAAATSSPTPPAVDKTLPRIELCTSPPRRVGEDHIPPMKIGDGGSLLTATDHDLTNNPEPIVPPIGPRKWRYTVTGTTMKYGNFQYVQPLIELDGYFDARNIYWLVDNTSADNTCALKLWLQEWDQSGQKWKEPPPAETDEAQIVVKGSAKTNSDPTYSSLVIEVDDKFSRKHANSHKKVRPFTNDRQFGANDDQFRIYRWAIVDANNVVITAQGKPYKGSLDDDVPPYVGFQFMLTFYHHH